MAHIALHQIHTLSDPVQIGSLTRAAFGARGFMIKAGVCAGNQAYARVRAQARLCGKKLAYHSGVLHAACRVLRHHAIPTRNTYSVISTSDSSRAWAAKTRPGLTPSGDSRLLIPTIPLADKFDWVVLWSSSHGLNSGASGSSIIRLPLTLSGVNPEFKTANH